MLYKDHKRKNEKKVEKRRERIEKRNKNDIKFGREQQGSKVGRVNLYIFKIFVFIYLFLLQYSFLCEGDSTKKTRTQQIKKRE